ncbi:GntR family transcriptional regulator [Saxibacter everestensis]|uniref:GntR family transcriptional regulator n=1 Tax=Saxibacter everestensis TaxID=2909229 RepID=A0ABY8QU23_9MICO|nr:GntR family transcriptional regulator [Brevibacteriaceae bacterium ZFBP1038]
MTTDAAPVAPSSSATSEAAAPSPPATSEAAAPLPPAAAPAISVAPSISKAETAYRAIRSRITDGSFSPGYRLTLSKLATDLGVSVVPVREAIRRLEAESLVVFERNIGATVAGINTTEYEWTMQTLGVVEGAATALAAELISQEDLARARGINDEMRRCLENFDPQRFTRLNNELHELLYSPCPNEHLKDLASRGWARLALMRSSIFSFVPGRAANSVAEHDHILDLIAASASPAEIESAVRHHRYATLHAFLDHERTQK